MLLNISSEHYKKILSVLNGAGGQSRLVGGCVRDALLNKQNPDIDIASTLLPNEVILVLQAANIKTLPTGINFGTISAFLEDETFEITTLRKDIKCSGRHARVEYTNDFEEDAQRRDFTINAISYCPFQNKIYDYFTGLEDLRNCRVRFIGQVSDRIQEDYLRILRFFRFSCHYTKTLDILGYKACIELQQGLTGLSRERIKWEMDKIILSDNSPHIMNQMYEGGILNTIFGIKYYKLDVFNNAINLAKIINIPLSKAARYALLFYKLENIDYDSLNTLKFTRADAKLIMKIIQILKDDQYTDNINNFLCHIWYDQGEYFTDFILSLAALSKISNSTAIEFVNSYLSKVRPKFMINGGDLYDLGMRGKEIKNSLLFLKAKWIDSNFILTKTELLNIIKK